MTNRLAVLLRATLCAALVASCTLSAPAQETQPVPVIKTDTALVVVDVVVQDKDGKPIHGLRPEDFQVSEDKQPQKIRNFEEHTQLPPAARGPALPKMPPGSFTNYTPVPPNGALNILLLDALNTPMKDQSFVRYELQQYVKKAEPGTRIAIFGLANQLFFLQGFTSDPETLKDVVDHKLIPRGSSLLDDPVSGEEGNGVNASGFLDASAPGMAQLAANVTQFEAEMASLQIRFRMQYTLDALNTLAHYLAAFPGRKNLIWFSGAFPINILPDGSLNDPFAVANLDGEEFRETTNLLAKAQVAVYPIDARGLMTLPMFSASQSGRTYAGSGAKFGAAVARFNTSQAAEHATMEQMAGDTGGHAFFNTNDLASAVKQAIDSGANYYTLTYTPADRRQNGSYRAIHVQLVGARAAQNLQLAYRRGYYSDDARSHDKNAVTATTTEAPTANRTAAYAHAAMTRGAPTPEDILFKVRVLPASTTTEATIAPGNQTDPNAPPLKGPFRRLDVDYAALPSEFTLPQQPGGKRKGSIEFIVDVYDSDGRLLNVDGKTFALNLPPETYKRFLQSTVQCHLEVSVPARTETYLRIGIRDVETNRFGVVEIPASAVARLPPPVYDTAPASTPSTQKPAATVPSTPAAPGTAPATPPQR